MDRKYILLLIPGLGGHRHAGLCELQASLGYIVSSSPARLHSKTVSPNKEKKPFFLKLRIGHFGSGQTRVYNFPVSLEWKRLLCCIVELFALVYNTLGAVLGARRVAEYSKSFILY